MDDPNLQTVPKPRAIDLASSQTQRDGAPALTTHNINMRAAFVAAPGHVLLSADYCQVCVCVCVCVCVYVCSRALVTTYACLCQHTMSYAGLLS